MKLFLKNELIYRKYFEGIIHAIALIETCQKEIAKGNYNKENLKDIFDGKKNIRVNESDSIALNKHGKIEFITCYTADKNKILIFSNKNNDFPVTIYCNEKRYFEELKKDNTIDEKYFTATNKLYNDLINYNNDKNKQLKLK